MSEATTDEDKKFEFEPILSDLGILFYEECPSEFEIDRPILLPLKSTTQIRFELLQQQAVQVWKEKQKTSKKK